MVSDVGAVIDGLGVDRVHLLGHDWGAIQGWTAVTDDSVLARIASLTSISGAHLDYAGRFLRSPRTPRALVDVARQILASSYIWFFLCPVAPEIAIRSRAQVKVFEAVERIGRSSTRSRRDASPGRSTTTSTGSTCTAPTCPHRLWHRRRNCRRPASRCRCW
ncbi:alpha/beta hydrolase fold family protein [Mycobacterium kansasii]|uniref:Alpha/beta hydrolase fold family protein n=1 Tax=Mycobacterium kansasii TaxID=1768 RepID=A0A1V3XZV7_MYCKA|nr:alpha/beta hydrolase fold family protein [Mycobacterium kansasii]